MTDFKTIRYIKAKGNNKRIELYLLEPVKENPKKLFILRTTTLKDFNTRNILIVENAYSIETMKVIHDLLHEVFTDPVINNKILFKEVNAIKQFKAELFFNND